MNMNMNMLRENDFIWFQIHTKYWYTWCYFRIQFFALLVWNVSGPGKLIYVNQIHAILICNMGHIYDYFLFLSLDFDLILVSYLSL